MARPRVVNKLPQFTSRMEVNAARALTQAVILGASEASVLTPIDTGTLLNSQFRHVSKDGSRIVGRAGYTADYAVPVHDPAVKQTFRRPTATKLFLKKGFERAEPAIKAVIKSAIKAK